MNEAICFDRCKVMMHFFKHCSETGPDEGRVKQGLFSHCAKYKVMIAVLKLNISLDCAPQRSRQQTLSFLIIHSRYRYKEGSSIYMGKKKGREEWRDK